MLAWLVLAVCEVARWKHVDSKTPVACQLAATRNLREDNWTADDKPARAGACKHAHVWQINLFEIGLVDVPFRCFHEVCSRQEV
jgi:hypothetical protein